MGSESVKVCQSQLITLGEARRCVGGIADGQEESTLNTNRKIWWCFTIYLQKDFLCTQVHLKKPASALLDFASNEMNSVFFCSVKSRFPQTWPKYVKIGCHLQWNRGAKDRQVIWTKILLNRICIHIVHDVLLSSTFLHLSLHATGYQKTPTSCRGAENSAARHATLCHPWNVMDPRGSTGFPRIWVETPRWCLPPWWKLSQFRPDFHRKFRWPSLEVKKKLSWSKPQATGLAFCPVEILLGPRKRWCNEKALGTAFEVSQLFGVVCCDTKLALWVWKLGSHDSNGLSSLFPLKWPF